MANKYVKLGDHANVFHDAFTGITLCKGEVIELNERQVTTKRIRTALQSGHLVYTSADDKQDFFIETSEIEILSKKLVDLYNAGKDYKKTSEAFNLEQLKALAKVAEIEIEDTDTKATITQALFEDIEESQKL